MMVRRHRTSRRTAVLGLGMAFVLLGSSCSTDGGGTPRPTSTVEVRPQYVALVDAVVAQGARVWVETDLLKAWLAGPDRYESVLSRVLALAARPGVDGVKIADELGYRDGASEDQVRDFLAAATKDIHEGLPGRKVLVDFIVPELGCVFWWQPGSPSHASRLACAEQERTRDPATSLAAVDRYIAAGGIDVIDLSPGLRKGGDYTGWSTSRDAAMAVIWDEASRRWGDKVRLQARKALAHPGVYRGTMATAEADVTTFVDIPLAHGAQAVDIWTWGQPYKDGTYTLTDPGLASNALVQQLWERRKKGVELWTHMTPSSLQVGLAPDVAAATAIFSTIFVASGTG